MSQSNIDYSVTKFQKRKKETIKEFQDSKTSSIKITASARDATIFVSTFYPELATDPDKEKKLKDKWIMWRNFFLYDTEGEFTKKELGF